MKNDVGKKDFFEKFRNLMIYSITSQFYLWRWLQNKENTEIYNQYSYFWWVIIPSLQQSFLLSLAKTFDRNNKTFSIYSYIRRISSQDKKDSINIELESPKYKEKIKSLKWWRDKYLAHREEIFVFSKDELNNRYPIVYWDIEDLLSFLFRILNDTKREFDPTDSTDYFKYYSQLEEWIIDDLTGVIKSNKNLFKS
jgi:hypothetical protein